MQPFHCRHVHTIRRARSHTCGSCNSVGEIDHDPALLSFISHSVSPNKGITNLGTYIMQTTQLAVQQAHPKLEPLVPLGRKPDSCLNA